jgi:predicted Zn-dependent protease
MRIGVVRDPGLNAFVTTGNRMFLNSGIIQQALSALEVAGAMAHETGHIAQGHISRLPDMAYQAMLETIGSLLIGAAAGVASRDASVGAGAAMGGQSMAQRRFLGFTRTQEEAADSAALGYLDRLGWSAKGLLALFDKLDQQEALVLNRRDPYLLTHPMSHERFERVKRHVEAKDGGAGNRPSAAADAFEPGFRLARAKLDGFLLAPTTVMRMYPGTDPRPEARYANAVVHHRMGHRSNALGALESLIREAPASPWFHEMRGQVLLESGRPAEAVGSYRTAAKLAPDQALIRQGLGHALLETGDAARIREAVPHLRAALAQGRDDPGAWHLLGLAQGRLGDLGEANLALAEEAMLYNDLPVAQRFAKMAADALPGGPSKLRALDIVNAMKRENRP